MASHCFAAHSERNSSAFFVYFLFPIHNHLIKLEPALEKPAFESLIAKPVPVPVPVRDWRPVGVSVGVSGMHAVRLPCHHRLVVVMHCLNRGRIRGHCLLVHLLPLLRWHSRRGHLRRRRWRGVRFSDGHLDFELLPRVRVGRDCGVEELSRRRSELDPRPRCSAFRNCDFHGARGRWRCNLHSSRWSCWLRAVASGRGGLWRRGWCIAHACVRKEVAELPAQERNQVLDGTMCTREIGTKMKNAKCKMQK